MGHHLRGFSGRHIVYKKVKLIWCWLCCWHLLVLQTTLLAPAELRLWPSSFLPWQPTFECA